MEKGIGRKRGFYFDIELSILFFFFLFSQSCLSFIPYRWEEARVRLLADSRDRPGERV